jgi:hypothetical protein
LPITLPGSTVSFDSSLERDGSAFAKGDRHGTIDVTTEVENEVARVENETSLHRSFHYGDLKEAGAPEVEMPRFVGHTVGRNPSPAGHVHHQCR